jgi:crotonobetainyl-CoA:carnitine CoA-transferase CaiB-like acyl-CoA transferase
MVAETAAATDLKPGALSGIKILDLSHLLAGPYCTMILADLGADVVKIEQPGGGDYSRRGAGYGRLVDGVRGYFASINRNKRSLVLDLKTPAGLETALRLADQADVLVENMSPGAADRLGLGYQALAARNPRLIYASCSAFGQGGDSSNRKGIDPVVQAISGLMSINGEADGPPVRVGISIGDIGAGLFLAMGIMGALVERDRSGQGQALDISMLDCQLALAENAIMRYLWDGEFPKRIGSKHPLVPATGAYPTADGYIVVGSMTENNWQAVCEGLERPDWLTDPRFSSGDARFANRAALEDELEATLKSRPTKYWLSRLESLGATVAPVNSIPEALDEPIVRQRGIIQQVVHAHGTTMPLVSSPLRLSRTPATIRRHAPLLAQDAREVLSEWLGTDDQAYQQLAETGAFSKHA